MNRKASALLATGLMIFSAFAALGGAAGAPYPAPGTPYPAPGARGATPNNDSEPNNDFGNATEITGAQSFGARWARATSTTTRSTSPSRDGGHPHRLVPRQHRRGQPADHLRPQPVRDTLRDPGADLQLTFTAFMTGYYYIYLPEMGPCDYTLTTSLGTAPPAADSDNSPAQATAIFPASGSPFSTAATASNQTDMSDFFKVHLNYSELVSTDVVKAFISAPSTGAFSIMLYAAGQTETDIRVDMPDPGLNKTLTYSPTAAGDYYLRVWAHHGSGQYSLKVSLFSGMADNNGMKEFASALDKTAPHWYNTSGDLTLGIDPDDFLLIGNTVPGQVFNCTATSPGYDAQDKTPTSS